MNTAYQDLLSSNASAAVSAGRALAGVNHNSLRGQLREVLVRDFLRPLLPPTLGIGRGEIVTGYDQHSNEQDIIVFDRALVPSLQLDGTAGLFPLESSLYTIEVKSVLNATELNLAHNSARNTEALQHHPAPQGAGPPEHVIPCLFAFDTDLTLGGKTEIQRYEEILSGAQPAIRGICVAGRGYWSWNGQWNTYPITYPNAEMLCLTHDILITYQRVSTTRVRAPLGHYTARSSPFPGPL